MPTQSPMKIDASLDERSRPKMIYPKYGRPYYSTTYREYNAKTRVYVHVANESVLENFGKRFDRPIEVYRVAAKQALAELGIEGRLNWSQKAGCSCGCSPGFILSDEVGAAGGSTLPHDVFVSIEGAPEEPLTERGANRLGQILSDPTITGAMAAAKPKTAKRNYRAMTDDNLRRAGRELLLGGEARERAENPQRDLEIVAALLSERGLVS